MERLTEQSILKECKTKKDRQERDEYIFKCMNKLDHTEDIEEKHDMSIDEMDAYITEHKQIEQELGVKLSVLFKVLKNGGFIKSKRGEIHEVIGDKFQISFLIREIFEDWSESISNALMYAEDIEKVALTKEELENDK